VLPVLLSSAFCRPHGGVKPRPIPICIRARGVGVGRGMPAGVSRRRGLGVGEPLARFFLALSTEGIGLDVSPGWVWARFCLIAEEIPLGALWGTACCLMVAGGIRENPVVAGTVAGAILSVKAGEVSLAIASVCGLIVDSGFGVSPDSLFRFAIAVWLP